MIERCLAIDHPGWLELRVALWPHCAEAEHTEEMASFCARPERFAQFVACVQRDVPVGLVEVALRADYVNGTATSPVAFVEGLYVLPQYRRRGIARALIACAEQWAQTAGCSELASDAAVENESSHAMHRSLGFRETERVVYFLKVLDSAGAGNQHTQT